MCIRVVDLRVVVRARGDEDGAELVKPEQVRHQFSNFQGDVARGTIEAHVDLVMMPVVDLSLCHTVHE